MCQNQRLMISTYIQSHTYNSPDFSFPLLSSCAYAVWLLTFAIQQWQSRAVRAHLICFLSHNISPPVTLYSSMATRLPREGNSLMAQPRAAGTFAFSFQWTAWNESPATSCLIDLVQAEMDITTSQTPNHQKHASDWMVVRIPPSSKVLHWLKSLPYSRFLWTEKLSLVLL